jgi:hypothetical protein
MAWRWKESLPLTSRARGNSPDTAGPDGPGLHGPCLPRGSARRLPGRSLPSSSRASSTAGRPTPSLEHEKAYGKQMEHLPNVDSVMPKMPSGADCRFDTECPIGFFCDANSGACLRAEDHPSSTTEYRSGFISGMRRPYTCHVEPISRGAARPHCLTCATTRAAKACAGEAVDGAWSWTVPVSFPTCSASVLGLPPRWRRWEETPASPWVAPESVIGPASARRRLRSISPS